MPEYANITYETKGRLAYVTISRPDRRNAIDPNTSRELRDAFEAFKSEDNVWVAILTGTGERRARAPLRRAVRRHHARVRVLEANHRRD